MEFHPERRQTTRIECCYQVQCSHPGGSWEASVVDMGLGGLRLRTANGVQAGQRLTLKQNDNAFGEIQVEVVWARPLEGCQRECGVVYRCDVEAMERSWVKDALRRLGFEKSHLYERRRHVRRHTTASANLDFGSETVVATILDLGLGGALVEIGRELPAGQALQLASPLLEGRLQCQVIYCRQAAEKRFRCGLSFESTAANRLQARLLEGYLGARD